MAIKRHTGDDIIINSDAIPGDAMDEQQSMVGVALYHEAIPQRNPEDWKSVFKG